MTEPPASPSSAPPSSPPPAYQNPAEDPSSAPPSSPPPVYHSPPVAEPDWSGGPPPTVPPPPAAPHSAAPPLAAPPPAAPHGAAGRRPGSILGAAVLLFVYAGISLITSAIQLVEMVMRSSTQTLGITLLTSNVMLLLVTVGMVVAALLMLRGRDIGRALALALSGYAVASTLSRTVFTVAVVVPDRWDLAVLGLVGVELLIGAVAGVAFVLLLTSGVADWFARQRLAQRPVPQG